MQTVVCRLLTMAALTASLSVAAGAQTIKSFISFPTSPLSLAANPLTNKVYVAVPNIYGTPTDNLAVIDGNADTLLQDIAVPQGSTFVAVDYFANRVYVAGCSYEQSPSPCTVTAIDGQTNKVVSTVSITQTPGFGLTGIAANPLTGLVYVANGSDNLVDIVDGRKSTLLGTISMNGNSPMAIAINPVLNRLYVPFGTNLTGVVDTCAKKLLSTPNFGSITVGAAANLVTGNVFITNAAFGPASTGVLNKNGTVLATIPVDDSPLGVDVDPVTNLAFVASTALDSLTVINGADNSVQTIVTGVPADYVAVNVATEKVYVSGPTGITVLTEK